MRARGFVRAGAMRQVAAFVDDVRPTVMGVCEIDAGDALSLATRFALEWAYRGRQALFWRAPFRAHAVHDRYLPMSVAKLFDRRGLLIVDTDIDGTPCTLAATQLSPEREAFIPELRFARRHLRGMQRAMLFADVSNKRIGFSGLGFVEAAEGIYARGFLPDTIAAFVTTV